MSSARSILLLALAPLAVAAWPFAAVAQTQPAAPAPDPASIQRQIDEIRAMKESMADQMGQLDARINALETELQATVPGITIPPPEVQQTVSAEPQPQIPGEAPILTTDTKTSPGSGAIVDAFDEIYDPNRGIVLAAGEWGELDVTLATYVRYLNQMGLDDSYTDSFGRTFDIDRRQEAQLQKVTFTFKGWLFDPKFRWLIFAWTANTSQGLGAQTVWAGNLTYKFNDALTVGGGIIALPTTRSTMYTYPHWLRVDNRTSADEYFRGSYTSGFWAEGEIVDRLYYRAVIANNLSTLGIDAGQLNDEFNTVSGALWWMPTTGEFGYAKGFGDFDWHEEVATLFGVSYTRSPEDAQSQPTEDNGFDNVQLRLSDGTNIFSPNAFAPGVQVDRATYQMASLNAGVKYRGWSFEGEYYARWIDDFEANGPLPVDDLFDHGFQLQTSFMPVRDTLQAYISASKIWGEFGNPGDVGVGLNWFPLHRRNLRLNGQLLYLNHSPVGGLAYPYAVGGNGWVLTTDAVLAF
ncbi:hypothetical protein [Brevundimonas lenta]|uniref:Porin n=1 Tax=Brevundimonas lenta TaxID=424796 RepID=A0A7W6JFN9_9CAUL|nr:hypothetical protein [Brevundimonas lenta]MBB4084299.1 hypothetical protein [Brevundimonas lenta]